MTLGPDRSTVSRWIRSEVAAGRMPRIRGGDGTDDAKPKDETKTDDKKPDGDDKKDDDPPKTDDDKKAKAVTVEIEGKTYVLQDEANRLIGSARAEGKQTGKSEAEQERRNAELQEQGNFKALYEAEQGKVQALEGEIAALKLNETKRAIAAKHGLSDTLADRLQGATDAELEEDAKKLAKELGTKEEPKQRKQPVSTEAGVTRSRNGSRDEDGKPKDESRRGTQRFSFMQEGDVKRW